MRKFSFIRSRGTIYIEFENRTLLQFVNCIFIDVYVHLEMHVIACLISCLIFDDVMFLLLLRK